MADLLTGSIVDGKYTNPKTTSSDNTSNSYLGKDAFLQLLVAQMKYQDPLNPSTDTEYVAQLAQFSSLEQLQNMNATSSNSQAFSLVGKTVVVQTADSSGNVTKKDGTVDYVTMQNGKAKLCINGTLYDMSDLYEVYDDYYVYSQGAPTVEEKELKVDYDDANQKDLTLKVSMGTTSQASALALIVNGKVIDSQYLSMENGVLTVKSEAFKDIPNGKYNVIVCFNNSLETTVTDKLSVTISGESRPKTEEKQETEGEKSDSTKNGEVSEA